MNGLYSPTLGSEFVVALTTAPDAPAAEKIARELVEQRLAACVNRLPGVRSIYRWEGKVVEEEETLLVIKTTSKGLEKLRHRLPKIHPYDMPELIVLPVSDGNVRYLDWVRRETTEEKKPQARTAKKR